MELNSNLDIFRLYDEDERRDYSIKYDLLDVVQSTTIIDHSEDNVITVLATFNDKANCYLKYQLMTNEELRFKILNNSTIDLRGKYVKNFSTRTLEFEERYKINNFNASYSYFDGNISFEYIHLDQDVITFERSNFGVGYVSFDGAILGNKTTDFSFVNFGDGSILFRNVFFGMDSAIFINCVFGNGEIYFTGSYFNDAEVYFSGTNFGKGDVDFSNIKFRGPFIRFNDAIFEDGDIIFDGITFIESDLSFINASFADLDIRFYNITFVNSNFVFDLAKFRNYSLLFFYNIVLDNSKISMYETQANDIEFEKVTFSSDTILKFDLINEFRLKSCINKEHMQIDGTMIVASFLESTNLGRIDLDWESCNVKQAIVNAYQLDEDLDLESYIDNCKNAAHDFLLLKENYRNAGQYEWEDAAYRAYMKYNTKAIDVLEGRTIKELLKKENKDERKKAKSRLGKKAFNTLFGKISGYGTMPSKIIKTCLLTMGVSALLLFIAKLVINYDFGFENMIPFKQYISHLGESAYFSVITFLTIGYKELEPMNWFMRAVASIEGFFGLLLMSVLTVTIMRKVLR